MLLGYCFSKTIWVCPMCKREVSVAQAKTDGTSQFIIIRLNDFMVLVSKTKFRIVAAILMIIIGYFYIMEPSHEYQPRVKIDKTWKSLATNCGYDMYMINSFKFNYLYSLYEDVSDWEIEAVYIG